MGTPKTPTKANANIIEDLKLYAFVLATLSLTWLLTGMGYFWPIWFLIGWIVGPHATPYFKNMFSYSQNQWKTAQEQILAPDKTTKVKSKKLRTAASDDSDIAGA